jgi:hypothetical protein
MRNIIVLILFVVLFVVSLVREPIDDTYDVLAGATNPTYGVSLDAVAGATDDDDDEDEEEDD